MSDFFGDDFTAELKSYFLNSLKTEVEKFVDLVDDALWKRIRSEVVEQTKSWAVDAKTNDFHFLKEWLEGFEDRVTSLENAAEFLKALKSLKEYAEALLTEKTDSAELSAKFVASGQSLKEILYLHCRYGHSDFAIPLINVIEISSPIPLHALPEKKQGLLGVIPFRGEALPVLSLQDFGFSNKDVQNVFYVICEHENLRFSVQVTETEDLLKLRESELQEVDVQNSLVQNSFVKRFFIKNNKSVMILDLEKLVA